MDQDIDKLAITSGNCSNYEKKKRETCMMMVWSGSDIIMQACAEADGFIGSAV